MAVVPGVCALTACRVCPVEHNGPCSLSRACKGAGLSTRAADSQLLLCLYLCLLLLAMWLVAAGPVRCKEGAVEDAMCVCRLLRCLHLPGSTVNLVGGWFVGQLSNSISISRCAARWMLVKKPQHAHFKRAETCCGQRPKHTTNSHTCSLPPRHAPRPRRLHTAASCQARGSGVPAQPACARVGLWAAGTWCCRQPGRVCGTGAPGVQPEQ